MSYLDDINIKSALHKVQHDLCVARSNIASHITSRSHRVFGGPDEIAGRIVKAIELHYNRLNILFTDDTHLTVQADPFDKEGLVFVDMEQEDALRLGLVSPFLRLDLVLKEKEAKAAEDHASLVKDLDKLVEKLGKDKVLKLLGEK